MRCDYHKVRNLSFVRIIWVVVVSILAASCSEEGVPFPHIPNVPDSYDLTVLNRSVDGFKDLNGSVAVYVHEVYSEYSVGILSQMVAYFDSTGHCKELFYRDRKVNRHLVFEYDGTGRRVEETHYLDSAGVPYDSLSTLYTHTTYRYSRNGHSCRIRFTDPGGKTRTFRLRYNRQGLVRQYLYPDGSRFSYEYDSVGRLECKTFPDASFETYRYYEDGTLSEIRNREGVTNCYEPPTCDERHDSCGRCVERVCQTNTIPVVTTFQYDDHDNWIRRTTTRIDSSTRIDTRTFKYY